MRRNGESNSFECIVAHYNEELSWLKPLSSETIIYSKGGQNLCLFYKTCLTHERAIGNLPNAEEWKAVRRLPNIGREAHTYLHHLVNCYDSLADVTLFVQGDAYNSDGRTPPHTTLSVADMKRRAIESNAEGFTSFTPVVMEFKDWDGLPWETDPKFKWWLHKNGKTMLRAKMSPAGFWNEYIGGPHPSSIYFASGAFFAVTADTIRTRPKVFYQKLLAIFTNANHPNPEYGHYIERLWGSIFLDLMDEESDSDVEEHSRTSQDLVSRTEILKELAASLPPLPISQEEFAKKREAWMKAETV